MLEIVLDWLKGVPKEYAVMIVAALPIAELRGSIPLALSFGMSPAKALWLSIIGNMSFVIPALFLLEPVSNYLSRYTIFKRFFDWQFARTRKKAQAIQKYEALALIFFVAIPLPMTGAWTGVFAASLFKVKFRYALCAIFTGVLIAGCIVLILSTLGVSGWKAMTG